MTTNLFSVGRDCTVVLTHPLAPNGGRLDLQHVTGFSANPEYTSPSVKRLDGIRLDQNLPNGWSGEFDLDRGNQQADLLADAIETSYFSGAPRLYGTLTQYIQEQDGSTTTFQFDNVSLKITQGSWRDDQVVKSKVMFQASRRRKV